MNDDIGDRMKSYEMTAEWRLMPLVPVCARLDGRAFHTFTQGLDRPFDRGMCDSMTQTCRWLVEQTSAVVGYTQSDEITLIWFQETPKSELFFGGRVQKMTSILASMASVFFNRILPNTLPGKVGYMPVFDCRVWSVPTQQEAANMLIWRQQDAIRNSVQMAARSEYSHNELIGKNTGEMHEMLFQRGINWSNYPGHFKNGTFVRRRKVERAFTAEELERLPPKHDARRNPNLEVLRTEYVLSHDVLTKLENRVEYIFAGADPH